MGLIQLHTMLHHSISLLAAVLLAVVIMLAGCQTIVPASSAVNDVATTPTTKNGGQVISTVSAEVLLSSPPAANELRSRWLNDSNCFAPCWEGVTPGTTSAADAVEIWQANPLFTNVQKSESSTNEDLGLITMNWNTNPKSDARKPIRDARYNVNSSEPLIQSIRLMFPPTTIAELIRVYGEPSHYIAFTTTHPHSSAIEPDRWYIHMIWLSHGLALDTVSRTPLESFDESLTLDQALYFRPGIEGFEAAVENPRHLDLMKSWQGFMTGVDSFPPFLESP